MLSVSPNGTSHVIMIQSQINNNLLYYTKTLDRTISHTGRVESDGECECESVGE